MSESNYRHRLIFVTAKDCSACVHYKDRYWNTTESELVTKYEGKLELIKIVLENKHRPQPDPNNYPADLRRFVRWFPTFILIEGKSWQNADPKITGSNRGSRLEGAVYYGQFVNDIIKQGSNIPIPNSKHLIPWIESTLLMPLFSILLHLLLVPLRLLLILHLHLPVQIRTTLFK